MFLEEIGEYRVILASASPRRQELLRSLGLAFDVKIDYETDESFPEDMPGKEIPLYLAEKKSEAYPEDLLENEILITADTIVYQDNEVLTKPVSYEDAFNSLKKLSDSVHFVYTGVCIRSRELKRLFLAETKVRFGHMKDEEIKYYIENFKPYDKAGAYGIQEWIGYIGVEEIEGSYFNVMGLPVHQIYRELEEFITKL